MVMERFLCQCRRLLCRFLPSLQGFVFVWGHGSFHHPFFLPCPWKLCLFNIFPSLKKCRRYTTYLLLFFRRFSRSDYDDLWQSDSYKPHSGYPIAIDEHVGNWRIGSEPHIGNIERNNSPCGLVLQREAQQRLGERNHQMRLLATIRRWWNIYWN